MNWKVVRIILPLHQTTILIFCKLQFFELMYFSKMKEEGDKFCLKKQLFRIALSGNFPGCYKSNTFSIEISGGF